MTAPSRHRPLPLRSGSPHSPSLASGNLNSRDGRPERVGDLPELTSQAGSGRGLWQLVQTPACPPHPFLTSREQISRARAPCQASAGTCSGWGHTLMLSALKLLHPAGEADTGSGKDKGEVRTGRGCHRPLTEASKDVESAGLGKCGQDTWSGRRGWLQVLEV